MSSMRFLLQKNVWKLTDGELPDKDEIVMLKYCTINLEDGETQVFESKGQFVGVKNGKANYTITIEEKFGEPSFVTLPNNFTKLIAWKRIDPIEEKPDGETDDKETADEETESFWEEYYDHGIFKFRCHFCRTDAERGSIGFYLPRRCPNCDSVMKSLNTTDGQFQMAEDETKETETEQPTPTKRKLVGAREVCEWFKDTSLGAELSKALRQVQFELGGTVLSVTETTTKTHDIEKQGFIIVYEYEEDNDNSGRMK